MFSFYVKNFEINKLITKSKPKYKIQKPTKKEEQTTEIQHHFQCYLKPT